MYAFWNSNYAPQVSLCSYTRSTPSAHRCAFTPSPVVLPTTASRPSVNPILFTRHIPWACCGRPPWAAFGSIPLIARAGPLRVIISVAARTFLVSVTLLGHVARAQPPIPDAGARISAPNDTPTITPNVTGTPTPCVSGWLEGPAIPGGQVARNTGVWFP